MTSLLIACALSACTPAAENNQLPHIQMAGSDRDAHGCIGSAGYTWSPVREACIRVFEAGLAFAPDPAQARAEGGAVLQAG